MNFRMAVLLVLSLAFALSAPTYAVSCKSPVYLTIYTKMPANASVGIDNISLIANLTTFQNTSTGCNLVGIPNQNVTFYLTSTNFLSQYYNTLKTLGTSKTNSSGTAALMYNSSLIGTGTFIGVARWYGNSTVGSVTSPNNASITLYKPVAVINTTCSGECGNITSGQSFTLTSTLCVGRPPFSWSTCTLLPGQKLTFYATTYFLGSGITNSSGMTTLTYNSALLYYGSYDVYSTWKGGLQYANATGTSESSRNDLFVFNSTSTTSTVTHTTTTKKQSSTTNQSSSSGQSSASTGSYNIYIYVVAAIVIIAIIAYGYMRYANPHRGHGHQKPSK